MSENITERREWPRLELKLNVEFYSGEEEVGPRGAGTTKNVSAGGVYFLTTHREGLKVGQNLGIELSGLSPYNQGPIFRTLYGKATVLRLDMAEARRIPQGNMGVAVRFDARPRIGVYRFSA